MVILKNIKKVSDSISANYYPEGKEPAGFMKIRIPDGEIVERGSHAALMQKGGVYATLYRQQFREQEGA